MQRSWKITGRKNGLKMAKFYVSIFFGIKDTFSLILAVFKIIFKERGGQKRTIFFFKAIFAIYGKQIVTIRIRFGQISIQFVEGKV